MLKLNTDEEKSFQFDINIQGIDYKELQGTLKFITDDVEYGFPIKILSDHISVSVPPLDNVAKFGVLHGKEVDCRLDVFGNGFYLSPWSGRFKLQEPVRMEARMTLVDDMQTVDEKEELPVKKTIAATLKEESIDEGHEIDDDIDDDEDTEVEMKPEKNPATENKGFSKAQLVEALEEVLSKKRKKKQITKKPQNVVRESKTAPHRSKPKQTRTTSKVSRQTQLVEVVSKTGKRYKVTPDVARRIQEMSRLVDGKLTTKIKKKSVVENKRHKVKPGNKDPYKLMESLGMKNKTIQKVMIEKAEMMGGDDPETRYAALENLLGVGPKNTLMSEYEKVHNSLRRASKGRGGETE